MGVTKKGTEPSRAERKAKKRKLEDAIPDLPGDNDNEVGDDGGEREVKAERKSKKLKTNDTAGEEKSGNKEKKPKGVKEEVVDVEDPVAVKKEKKAKSKSAKEEAEVVLEKVSKKATSTEAVEDMMTDLLETPDDIAPKKSKKERKAERKAKEAAEKPAQPTSTEAGEAREAEGGVAGTTAAAKSTEEKKKNNNRNRDKKRKEKAALKDGSEKDPRFIVFIGNLPFSATKDSVTKHFASVKPKSVRLLTEKGNPSKSRGMGFVEFDGYDHMKTCLKLFHHSEFNDGISPARKINVELSAGGGGNSDNRKAKITDKNVKLNDERARRIQEEEKAKFTKKKDGPVDDSGIHPSRRARVPGTS